MLLRHLHLKAYKLSIDEDPMDKNKVVCKEFGMQMFHWIQDDERFLDSVIFSDESMFHVSCEVSTHNCRIWGSENPLVSMDHVRDSLKMNVFCALSKESVYCLFFMETTITGVVASAVPHSTVRRR
jgi:hypothetical protein